MTPKDIVDIVTQISLQDVVPLTLLFYQLRISEQYFKVIKRTDEKILDEIIERNKNESK